MRVSETWEFWEYKYVCLESVEVSLKFTENLNFLSNLQEI
jgi:hypothetical protein